MNMRNMFLLPKTCIFSLWTSLLLTECKVAYYQLNIVFKYYIPNYLYENSVTFMHYLYLPIIQYRQNRLKITRIYKIISPSLSMKTQPLLFFYRRKRLNDQDFTLLQYFWASTALTILITMPMLGLMLYFHFNYNNLLFGTLIGFSIHILVLAFSKRLSSMLINLVSL